jgi:hypothetical protein
MAATSILLHRGNYRQQFADFLDRLAAGTRRDEEWLSFVVTHYPDEFLEEMRRCTVRLDIGEMECELDSAQGRQLLHAWAIAIRSASRKVTKHDIETDRADG